LKKKRVLIFYPQPASFIKKDIEILSSVYDVRAHNFQATKKYFTPVRFISQLYFLFINIFQTDLIVCEFAAYHSFLPALIGRIFGRPCLMIVGGNDCHNFPALLYGNYTKKLLSIFTKWSLQLCSHVAPKHETLIYCDYTYDKNSPHQQGIKSVIKNFNKPYTVIRNGYDVSKWYCDTTKKPDSFITVCNGLVFPFQYQLKGIDLIVGVAPFFPQATFTILGVPVGYSIPDKPANIELIGSTSNDQLRAIYSTQQFYMQLSMAEGFPNALCEAMLCECIPVGSNVFSISEIIGDTGFILQERNLDLLKHLISGAMSSDKTLGTKARKRVADNYTIAKRETALLELCEKLMH
jgi:glycosyltransferase involved in cell wall biosynthesis